MEDMNLDELDELEDEEEERILEEYRKARMAEIKNLQAKSKFGSVGKFFQSLNITFFCYKTYLNDSHNNINQNEVPYVPAK